MQHDLRHQLQSSLGSAYTLERELRGGGMSRVFLASETSLGRTVVIKVLSPDLAAGVNVERFRREIQLAARLQHAHIVPVLATGETDGLPFYTMPFVEGESLRARFYRGGFSITDAVSVLRDVARALAFAHAHGVVHRDIKPENVLLAGGSAVVTDFGIAKALSAARTDERGATLTEIGMSLGTPAYMAPEQVAGDPNADHRADIYAFGVMAYEMLAGRPPFTGVTPQKLLAAHLSERPQPVLELRPDTPASLADLVMRCLEKEPMSRPHGADDIVRVLETVTSSAAHTAMPAVLLGGRRMLKKALLLYAAAFVIVAVVAKAAIVGIGLPDWVFSGAIVVMALGLPVILFTAYVQRATHKALTTTPQLTPAGSPVGQSTLSTFAVKASPHVSWRRTALGGMYAGGAFILLIAAYMVLRALGIGPAGSLMAAGKIGERERIILADFRSPSADSVLGLTVTEAFRTDLAQSKNLSVMPATSVREVLRRMQRPENAPMDFNLAREIAAREGIKAVVDGQVVELGGSYVLSARLVTAQSGEELAAFRETAQEKKDIIPAISRLAKQLRSRVGESLREVQSARTLDKVTTPSLEALQKYVQSVRALEADGDWPRGRALLEEAIAIDTGFAMAYRKLAVELNNRFAPRSEVEAVIQKAFDHRERLSDAERYLTVAAYYSFGRQRDRAKVISAYESSLEIDPNNVTALNNLAVQYRERREFAKAEELARRAIAIQPTAAVFFNNALWSQISQSKFREAEQTVELAARSIPRNPMVAFMRTWLLTLRKQYDSAGQLMDSLRSARASDPSGRVGTEYHLRAIAMTRGRLAEGARWTRQARLTDIERGITGVPIEAALDTAELDAWFRGRKAAALTTIDGALSRHPLDSLPLSDRPYDRLAYIFSLVGRTDRAKEMLAGFDDAVKRHPGLDDDIVRHGMLGHIAMAEARYTDAVREYRESDAGSCTICALRDLARAYDLAGNADSAIAVFERYIETPYAIRIFNDFTSLAGAHKRLGELYEAKGDTQRAISHYARFVDLWKDADPELQPQVRDVKQRLARLQRSQGD